MSAGACSASSNGMSRRPSCFNRFSPTNNSEPQDILQVWFAGVHSDVGGGYPEKRCGLSKFPLLWMIDEAVKCGLRVNQARQLSSPWASSEGQSVQLCRAEPTAELHKSLTGAWWLLEPVPKRTKDKEWPARQAHFGFYIPAAEPRPIPEGAYIHESAVQRMDAMGELSPGEPAGRSTRRGRCR